jgi:carnitine O-acetyltransferase
VERVIKMAGKETGAPVGALTAENRDIWTDVSTWRFSSAVALYLYPSRHVLH